MISKIIIFKFFYNCKLRRHVTSISSHILNICKNCCYFVIVSYWWNWILTTQACDIDNTISIISKNLKELSICCDSNSVYLSIYLGPVCLRSGFDHRSLMAYCATLNCHSAQIKYHCVSYKETEVFNWGCAYIFWFSK